MAPIVFSGFLWFHISFLGFPRVFYVFIGVCLLQFPWGSLDFLGFGQFRVWFSLDLLDVLGFWTVQGLEFPGFLGRPRFLTVQGLDFF